MSFVYPILQIRSTIFYLQFSKIIRSINLLRSFRIFLVDLHCSKKFQKEMFFWFTYIQLNCLFTLLILNASYYQCAEFDSIWNEWWNENFRRSFIINALSLIFPTSFKSIIRNILINYFKNITAARNLICKWRIHIKQLTFAFKSTFIFCNLLGNLPTVKTHDRPLFTSKN